MANHARNPSGDLAVSEAADLASRCKRLHEQLQALQRDVGYQLSTSTAYDNRGLRYLLSHAQQAAALIRSLT